MLRICLIIAIVAGLGAGALSFTKVKEIIDTTRAERNDWHQKDDKEVADHNKTKKTLKDTSAKLATTEKNLEQTKGQLASANNKVDELTKNNADLTDKLNTTTAARDEAQQELEKFRQLGVTPEQIKGIMAERDKLRQTKEALIGENKMLVIKVNEWADRWDNFFHDSAVVPLPTGLRGKVVAVDPKFNFVVLNIGEEQGAKQRGEMMVDHDGKFLGKVRISSVSKTECVANILPDWKRGEIMEGDEVLY